MIWIALYLSFGLLAFLFTALRHERMGLPPSVFLCFDLWLFPVQLALWPIFLIGASMELKAQLEEKKERYKCEIEQRQELPEDLSRFVGAIGRSITPFTPHGRIEIGDWQFDAISESGFLPRKTQIVVTGVASFGEMSVTRAEQFGVDNPVKRPQSSKDL